MTGQVESKASRCVEEATQEIKRLRAKVNRVLQILELAKSGQPLRAQSLIRKTPKIFGEVRAQLKALIDGRVFIRAAEELDGLIAESRLRYKDELEQALQQAQISFSGQWPAYRLNDIIELHVDLKNDRVRIDRNWLSTLKIEKVINSSQKVLKDLLERPFDPGPFLRALLQAYEECKAAAGAHFGEYVAIKHIFQSLSKKFGPAYTMRHFAIDLFRLLQSTPAWGLSVDFSPARSPSSGIFIPGNAAGYVSGIRITGGQE